MTILDSTERLDILDRRLARIERMLSALHKDQARGFVYILSDGHGRYKIGVAKDIAARMKGLATGGAAHQLVCTIESDNAYALEREIHAIYRSCRRHLIREWYALAQPDIDALEALAQPFFVEELSSGLAAIRNAARQIVSMPLAKRTEDHPTGGAARALVNATEAARAAALFQAGKDVADIIRELRGDLKGAARQQASAEVQKLIREGQQS
jgi:predicted GIY-YIG superfamily endonuclease